MRRLLLAGALLGGLIFASSAPAQAQYYYRRPMARAAARLALPPYGGYGGYGYGYGRPWYGAGYYRPRPYYGPRYYGGYSGWGYGPGAYIGLGVF